MELTNISFLTLYLPVCLFLYYLAPQKLRPAVLLMESLVFYLLADPQNLPALLFSLLMDYFAIRMMGRHDSDQRVRRFWLVFAVAKNLIIIIYFGVLVQTQSFVPALGLMVFALSGIDCAFSVYRREVLPERNFVRFALYCCFFPRLYAGPLMPYSEFVSQPAQARLIPADIVSGAERCVIGAVKYAVFGTQLGVIYETLRAYTPEQMTVMSVWCVVLSFALSIYYRLSGLSEMAQGIGQLFGLKLPHNFYYPYQSRSVEDFFQRFNSTVGRFIRRTVYADLQEESTGSLGDAFNWIVVGVLSGLWFGFRINYLLWGAYIGLFIAMERYLYPKLMRLMPTLFARGYTLLVVILGFIIFAANEPVDVITYLGSILGFAGLPFANDDLLYLLSSNWLLLVLSVFFATNIASLGITLLRRALPRLSYWLSSAAAVAVFAILIALLV